MTKFFVLEQVLGSENATNYDNAETLPGGFDDVPVWSFDVGWKH